MNFMEEDEPLFEPYSVRNSSPTLGLYSLDPIPDAFRAQLVHILNRLVGTQVYDRSRSTRNPPKQSADLWESLAADGAEAVGRLSLSDEIPGGPNAVANFVASSNRSSTSDVLDIIEVVIHSCRSWKESAELVAVTASKNVDQAIRELNQRFRQHHLGYRIQNDLILRIDSQYAHEEITERAFRLLGVNQFRGALDEFESAHRHYLDCEPRQAIGAANSALESTLKTICDRNGWKYDPDRDGAKRLIDIVIREKRLIPELLEPSFKKLVEVLELGLPKFANRQGRHGQGSEPFVPGDHLVAYSLHLTASNMILLIEAYQDQSPEDE